MAPSPSLPERGWPAGEGHLPLSLGKQHGAGLGVPLAFPTSMGSLKQVPTGDAKKGVTPTAVTPGAL